METAQQPVAIDQLGADLLRAIRDPGAILKEIRPPEQHITVFQQRAALHVLTEGGWIMDGIPPVNQVLADARQFSDELVITKLVARFFRVMILGGVVLTETPAAMNWLKDYIDGTLRGHGPLGKPMLWPTQLTVIGGLLREWGFQPTPTTPPFVSLNPNAKVNRDALPVLPNTLMDPRSVEPVALAMAANMGTLLDSFTGDVTCMAFDRATAIRAMAAAYEQGRESAATEADSDDFDALAAVVQLRDHQRQASEDGSMVTVSREAVDIVVAYLLAEGGAS